MRYAAVFLFILVIQLSASGQGPSPIPDTMDFQLNDFLPISIAAYLPKGEVVQFTEVGTAYFSTTDAVDYFATLTINNKQQAPYEFRTLPVAPPSTGQISASATWHIKVTGPRVMKVRIQLTGDTFMGKKHYDFKDLTFTYHVQCTAHGLYVERVFERLFHRCY